MPFSQVIRAGVRAGVDAVVIETMTDLHELKAAVLAARECCDLPVLATAAFGENGRLLTGGDGAALVSLLEGLGVSALGLNCGAGPLQLSATVEGLLELASVPVIFKPNAGMPRPEPDGTIRYDIDADTFARAVAEMVRKGVRVAGGCCGTTPEHIARLHAACGEWKPAAGSAKGQIWISSGAQALDVSAVDLREITAIAVPEDPDDLLDEVFDRQDEGEPLLRLDFSESGLDPLEAVEAVQEVSRLPLWLEGAEAARLERELAAALEEARRRGEALRAARQEAAAALEARIQEELAQLDMPKVRFRVEFAPKPGEWAMDETGMDQVQFLMSANVGEDLKPIQKIASGGELARIMLALKNVLAENDQVGTMVFDEVDTGVSGRAAQKVAEKLAQVARAKQVLCVTHLPQLAAMADVHFSVEKGEQDGRTFTRVERLDRDRRTRELARLTSGDHLTGAALAAAGELLDSAERFKQEMLRKS